MSTQPWHWKAVIQSRDSADIVCSTQEHGLRGLRMAAGPADCVSALIMQFGNNVLLFNGVNEGKNSPPKLTKQEEQDD